MRLHESKTDADLIERLRQLGAQWFKNEDLLALEELIYRYNVETTKTQNTDVWRKMWESKFRYPPPTLTPE